MGEAVTQGVTPAGRTQRLQAGDETVRCPRCGGQAAYRDVKAYKRWWHQCTSCTWTSQTRPMPAKDSPA